MGQCHYTLLNVYVVVLQTLVDFADLQATQKGFLWLLLYKRKENVNFAVVLFTVDIIENTFI